MINLETVLSNLNDGYTSVIDLVPNRYNFKDENYDIGPWDGGPGMGQALFIQADGKLVWGGISGYSDKYDPEADEWYYPKNIVRFNTDGSVDTTFTSPNLYGGGNGMVMTIGQQSSGKLIVGGFFYGVQGSTSRYLLRLNTDGSIDETFTGGKFDGNVHEIRVLGDDSILVGHQASYFDSTALSSRISKLSANGVLDTTFDGNATAVNNRCHAVTVAGDGSIYAGGNFTNGIVKLNADGTTDATFDVGSGFSNGWNNSRVSQIAIQEDGKLIVGSWYKNYNGTSADYVCRLNTDGSLDNTFATEGTGFDEGINTVAILATGKVLVGGWFNSYNGNQQMNYARLNSDGTLDDTFDVSNAFSNISINWGQRVQNILVSGSKIYIAHSLFAYKDNNSYNLTVTDLSGVYNSAFQFPINFNVDLWSGEAPIQWDSVLLASGKLLVCGEPCILDTRKAVRRYNVDGTEDDTFVCPPISGNDNIVRSLGIQSTGKIIMAGAFNYVGGIELHNIVRLNADGSLDETFTTLSFSSGIWNVEVLPDDKLIVTGQFTTVDGNSSNYICKLTADGALDATSSVLDGMAFVSKTDADGKIYVGGRFSNKIVRLASDLTLDATFDVGTGFGNGVGNQPRVSAIEIDSNGKLVVGHWFTSYNGSACSPGISRLNTDGTLDETFATEGTGLVFTYSGQLTQAVKILANGKILVGGWFNEYNGEPQLKLIQLNSDGTKDTSFDIAQGFNSWSRVQSIQADTNGIYLVGNFGTYNGWARYPVVRLLSDGQLDTTYKSQCWTLTAGIDDGGNDMFDGGNFLYTDLTQDFNDGLADSLARSLALPNTHTCLWGGEGNAGYDINDGEYLPLPDGEIKSCDDYFGSGSTYFTNMYEGMFVMCANDISVDQFSVMGDMGSSGTQEVYSFKVPGHNYHCHAKVHYDSGDPTCNMLILMPGDGQTITPLSGENTGYQDFGVSGLTGIDHLFYLMVSTGTNAPMGQQELENLAAEFLHKIGVGGFNTYQFRLTAEPQATEGSAGGLDTTVVDGVSKQRTVYLELVDGETRIVVVANDGETVSDEPQTLTDFFPCEPN